MSKRLGIDTVAIPPQALSLMRVGACSDEQRRYSNEHYVGKLSLEYAPTPHEATDDMFLGANDLSDWATAFAEFDTTFHNN